MSPSLPAATATAGDASPTTTEPEMNKPTAWWTTVRWIAEAVVLPCAPILIPLLPRPSTVTATILCPQNGADRRVALCLQLDAASPFVLLDLPIPSSELAGACRVALECDRDSSAAGTPLMDARKWAVYCNGRRAGFGKRRAATAAEARALEAVKAVSAGAGILPGSGGGGGGGFAYLRGRFERVVGSADSESYHLIDPTGCFGQELSFFFLRV